MDNKRELKTALVKLFLGAVLVCVFESGSFGQPWDGNGVEGDPYQIWTAADMQAIGADSAYWDAHFKLMADIDIGAYTGTSFNIIGNYTTLFTGVFDGNGHTISNFTYSTTGKDNIGLFRYIDGPSAEIKDLGMINPNVSAGDDDWGWYVGSLVGSLADGTISNCYVQGGSISGSVNVGGLVGIQSSLGVGMITGCHSSCSVSGDYSVGGLAGRNRGIITDCYTTGSVSGDERVGGLVGDNLSTITNCYSTGSVIGNTRVGGLVGSGGTISNSYARGSVSGVELVGGLVGSNAEIFNCYSTASVSGTGSYVGGLVGKISYGSAVGSFWDIQTSGQTTSDGGTPLTTAEMKDPNTYLYWGGCMPSWTIDPGVDYPHLIWENQPGEIISYISLSDFVAGAGTESEPYLIYTAEELNTIGLFWCELDKHFKLMSDIDLSGYTGTSFNIIGSGGFPFGGVFDGNGHTISNFTYSSTRGWKIGLFGYVAGESAEVKDLSLINPNVDAGTGKSVGSLVGMLEDATITGCYVEGGSVSAEEDVGGLVGYIGYECGYESDAIITNCYSTASVSGVYWGGGLAGRNRGTITNCYSTGSVSGQWQGGD